jgi:hypothetical protein
MAYADASMPPRRFGETARPDAWWVQPLRCFWASPRSSFIRPGRRFIRCHHGNCAYWFNGNGADYLSPFFSPGNFRVFAARDFWTHAGLVAGVADVFARHFWCCGRRRVFGSPVTITAALITRRSGPTRINCAVGEPRKTFLGERYFPLILQNIHRYFMYLAVIFIFILGYDAWKAMWFTDASGTEHFGIGVGTLVLIVERHSPGQLHLRLPFAAASDRRIPGREPSKAPACAKGYACVSCLNRRHMLWAWISLFWVGFTDVYVRLCAMGIWHDFRFF